jgi:hypothetical protein
MTQLGLTELKAIAIDFLEGRLRPVETAVALAPFREEAPEDLRHYLTSMVAVASETDDIPLGDRRAFWHPHVRAKEDEKHDRAQAWAEPMVRETCEALVRAS